MPSGFNHDKQSLSFINQLAELVPKHIEESKCTCSGILAAAVSPTVIISLVISIIIFITGFMFGNHFRINLQFLKRKPRNMHVADHPHQAPEYEDIDAQPIARAMKHQEKSLELKKNVAYCPSKSITKIDS